MQSRFSAIVALRRSFALALAVLMTAPAALADPPGHAKAHGWRKKHDPYYVGYTGRHWPRDYGIVAGRCNREEIGTVLGAVVGGAVGSQIGDGSGRAVAVVVGSVLGAVIGREIGERLDERDRACIGHALELIEPGHPVRWANEGSGVSYVLTALADERLDARTCRRYELQATHEGKARLRRGRACRDSDGTWSIAS